MWIKNTWASRTRAAFQKSTFFSVLYSCLKSHATVFTLHVRNLAHGWKKKVTMSREETVSTPELLFHSLDVEIFHAEREIIRFSDRKWGILCPKSSHALKSHVASFFFFARAGILPTLCGNKTIMLSHALISGTNEVVEIKCRKWFFFLRLFHLRERKQVSMASTTPTNKTTTVDVFSRRLKRQMFAWATSSGRSNYDRSNEILSLSTII